MAPLACSEAAGPGSVHGALDAMPVPAYSCDAVGRITSFNERAAALWGRRPALNDFSERFSGAERLLTPDGLRMAHECSPTALAIAGARPYEDCETVIVRPDPTNV